MLSALGVLTLNSVIRFGNKLIVVDDKGISMCIWRVRCLKWEEIEDVQLKSFLGTEYLVLQLKNQKRIEINLDGKRLDVSSEDIYSYILETWVEVNTNNGKPNM